MRLVSTSILAFSLAACGPGASCGPGTVEVDGQCVPASDDTGAGGDDTGTPQDTGTSDTGETVDTGDTTTGPGAPNILNFSTNVTRLTRNQSITFSVVVTDPEGIDDLIGGQLVNPEGGTYGSFQTSAAEGSYSLQLTWADINQVAPINVESTEATRFFRAEFYDQGGAKATRTVAVALHCDGRNVCEGTCVDLDEDADHCGTCNTACDEQDTCNAGTCEGEVCTNSNMSRSCSDLCASFDGVCIALHEESGGGYGFVANTANGVCPSPSYSDGTVLTSCSQRFDVAQADATNARCACAY